MRISDWSSDVCSSDLGGLRRAWVAWAVHYLWEAWAAHCLWEGCRDSTSRCKILVLLPMNVLGERSSGCSGPSARGPRETLRSEEHTSELQSLMRISYAVLYLKKQNTNKRRQNTHT